MPCPDTNAKFEILMPFFVHALASENISVKTHIIKGSFVWHRTKTFTVCRHVCALFSPETLHAVAVERLMAGKAKHDPTGMDCTLMGRGGKRKRNSSCFMHLREVRKWLPLWRVIRDTPRHIWGIPGNTLLISLCVLGYKLTLFSNWKRQFINSLQ